MLTVPQITCDHVSDERRSDHFSVDYYDSSGEQASRRRGRTRGSAPGAGGGLGGPRGRSLLPHTSCPPLLMHGRGPRPSGGPGWRPALPSARGARRVLPKASPHPGGTLSCFVPGARPALVMLCGWHPVTDRGWPTCAGAPPPGPGNQSPRRRPLPWRPSLLDLSWTPPEGSGSCEDSVTISGTPEGDKLILCLTL